MKGSYSTQTYTSQALDSCKSVAGDGLSPIYYPDATTAHLSRFSTL